MPIEAARQADWQKWAEREIRRLRLRMEAIAQGSRLRSTEIIGVIPSANRPVEWYFNANLLGLGVELELHEGEGVWITGTFVAGRAHYYIGAYATGGGASGTVAWYANQGLLGNGLEADFREASDVWISGTWVGSRAVYYVGTYGTVDGGGISGTSFNLNDGFLGFGDGLDLHEGLGVWISGSFANGEATYEIGAYAQAGGGISGVDFLVEGGHFGFGRALDQHAHRGLWVSGTMVGDEAQYDWGVDGTDLPYDAADVNDWDHAHNPSGVAQALDQIADRLATGQLSIDAGAMRPSTTNGAEGPLISEWGTNDVDDVYISFPEDSTKYAQFKVEMPVDWDDGELEYEVHWTPESGTWADAQGVRWELQAISTEDGDAIDVAWGTTLGVTDAYAEGDASHDKWTVKMTGLQPAGMGSGGRTLRVRLNRDHDHAGDTGTGSAWFLGMLIGFVRREA